MDSNKRMAVNTVILYVKLVITIIVNLYSTRLILNAVGVEDYGVINLISGIVAMLSFVRNSMSVSSQRYMSVYMGKHDDALMVKVFNSSFVLHLMLAVFILILLEILAPMIFSSSIQIPEQREFAAKVLYQLTILGTILVVMTVPYDAALNAHENMLVFSIASIIESLIRLVGAFILLVYSNDKLIFYGFLLITIRLTSLLIKYIYCRNHYKETKVSIKHRDQTMAKEMLSFTFWNMFAALATTGRSQGVAIVMNVFLGVVVNASFGIANQISGQLQNFSATISKAMNPQIMQRAGSGNQEGMISLALKQCKYSSILLSYAIVPLLFSMPFILKIWLGKIPEYCVAFSSLILIVAAVQQLTVGLMSAIQATGIIRNYQIFISVTMLLNIPLAYVLLELGCSAPTVLIGMLAIEIILCFIRVLFARKLAGLIVGDFIKNVSIPIVGLYLATCVILFFMKTLCFEESNFISFLVLSVTAVIVNSIMAYVVLTSSEREFFFKIIKKRLNRKTSNSRV